MGDYGIKISKEGSDVKTATRDDLIITSSKNCLKLDEVQTTTITVDAFGVGTKTIAHGLSFAPVVTAIIDFTGVGYGYLLFPYGAFGEGSGEYSVDTTNIIFDMWGADPGTYNIYYFVSETESAS